MPILHKYKNKEGYYITVKKFKTNAFSTYQIGDDGLRRLQRKKIHIGEGERISPSLFKELYASGEVLLIPIRSPETLELFPHGV